MLQILNNTNFRICLYNLGSTYPERHPQHRKRFTDEQVDFLQIATHGQLV